MTKRPSKMAVKPDRSKYYDSKELAVLLGFSLRWVVKWRVRIVGAQNIGGRWRFSKDSIDRRVAANKDVRSGF
jgi:RNA:NAD 2'-phosphotransferase (TPT1/KptA family)